MFAGAVKDQGGGVEGGGDVPAVAAGDDLDGGGDIGHERRRGHRSRPCAPARRRRAGSRPDRRRVGRPGEQQLAARRDDALDVTRRRATPAGSPARRGRPTHGPSPRPTAARRQGAGAAAVVRQPDGHRRAVGDRHDDGGGRRQIDPLDRHVGRRAIGEHVAPRERTGDRQRRVVDDLDERAPAAVGDGPHAVDRVAAGDAQTASRRRARRAGDADERRPRWPVCASGRRRRRASRAPPSRPTAPPLPTSVTSARHAGDPARATERSA